MPSLPISRKPEKLVVDANPIISALLGGNAKRLFFESDITEFAVAVPPSRKCGATFPRWPKAWRKPGLSYLCIGPVTVHHLLPQNLSQLSEEARIQIAHRDQGDVEILALTLALKRPLWTNDKDFSTTSVQTLTTAELLATYFPK